MNYFLYKRSFLSLWIIFITIISLCASSSQVFAIKKKHNQNVIKQPTQSSLVVDSKNGKILYAHNEKKRIFPASLVKVMTVYLLFEKLASKQWSLEKKLHVSKYAASAEPSKLYLKHGEKIKVADAINALIIKSANDVARVVGENISGSEKNFAKLMNMKARQLGMRNTKFTNASGLHDVGQYTTATDLAKLAIAIKHNFPKYYALFSKTSFRYNGKDIRGHNRLTENYIGAEGLKTGFTRNAGYNLLTAATRGKKSLVAIVTGEKNSRVRDKKMAQLLDRHF